MNGDILNNSERMGRLDVNPWRDTVICHIDLIVTCISALVDGHGKLMELTALVIHRIVQLIAICLAIDGDAQQLLACGDGLRNDHGTVVVATLWSHSDDRHIIAVDSRRTSREIY